MTVLRRLRLRIITAAGLFVVMAAAALTATWVSSRVLMPMILGLLPLVVWLGVTHPKPPRRPRQ